VRGRAAGGGTARRARGPAEVAAWDEVTASGKTKA
jgi:hypothetical protein